MALSPKIGVSTLKSTNCEMDAMKDMAGAKNTSVRFAISREDTISNQTSKSTMCCERALCRQRFVVPNYYAFQVAVEVADSTRDVGTA